MRRTEGIRAPYAGRFPFLTDKRRESLYWWLRSSGRTGLAALEVLSDGSINFENVSWGYNARDNMYNSGGCVRPALWVKVS